MIRKLLSIILTCAMLINLTAIMPINAFAASGSSRTYEKDGYSVTYIVGSEWDNSQTIYITLKNTGKEPILNWALKYDNLGSVSDIWNAYVAESTDEYIIVKNNGYNFEIPSGKSVNFGYTLSYEEKAEPEDIEIFSKRIEVRSGYETEFNVTDDWYTGFQGEISVSNTSDEPIEAWTLNFDGNFDINNIWNAKLLSNENRNYITAAELWTNPINPGEKISFGFTASKSATDNIIADNFKLTAVTVGKSSLENDPEKEDPDEDIDYELNSDNDGLPDYYEDILGTDKNNADTDGDGLPDGYEVFYLGTDPTKADSDDNGTNDGDEDFDNDGLSNKKEYELGTDPNNADTDSDGLSDGAEVNTHGTDPLKYDTDEDGISDGDELKLGLDPKNGSTDGTPDSEKTFTQTVSADSEVLSEINNDEETPFKVSLEITAAGVAENNVYARESGYSNAIENSAIIGTAPEFVYTDGLSVEEVTVKFELESSAVSNTLGTYAENNDGFKGIKRLMVFMFFEDVNMLLPVETEYDEANNTVSATTDRVGTYCLMDMEMLFKNLGIEPDNSINSVDKIELMAYNGNNDTADCVYKDDFDVVFMVDEINYSNDELSVICDKIYDTSKAIFNTSANVTVRVYGLNGKNKQTGCDFYGRTDNVNGLESILKKVSHTELSADDLIDISRATSISEAIDYVALSYIISNIDDDQFKDNFNFEMNFSEAVKKASELGIAFDHEEFGFIFFDADRTNCNVKGFDTLFGIGRNSYNIKQSIVSNVAGIENKDEYKYSYARVLFDETEGKNFDIAANREVFVEDVLNYIYGKVPTEAGAYDAIIATGYSTVVLDKPLTEHDMELAEKRFDDPEYVFSDEEVKSCADTDRDGLFDFEEVMFFNKKLFKHKLIKFKNNEIQLPNVNTILNALNKLAYVDDGLEKAREQYGDCWETFLAKPVLPINSHPTSADGDSDGIIDIKDVSPLSNKQNVKYSQNLYKDNSSKFTYDQQFNMNFTWFFEDCTKYNRNLALASIIYAGLAYHTTYVYGPFWDNNTPVSDSVSKTDGEYYYAMEYSDGEMLILPQVMELYGFEKNSIETINLRNCKDDKDNYYNDNHYIQFDIGKKDISQYNKNAATNTPRNVVGIFVRGTHGTPEWYSNFDIGNTDEFHKNTDWRTKENHMGFDIAAVRAKKEIDTYLSSHDLNKDNTVIWLAGHSRGAAVSGIIATYLIADGYKVFAYNFVTPNQVEVADSSKIKFVECPGVFNIINADDLVPCLPLEGWNFVKYGENIYHESLSENQRKEWAKKDIYAVDNIIYDIDLKHAEYDNAPKALKFTLDSFNKICNKRNDCYSPSEGDEYILYVNDELKSILEEVDPQLKYFSLKNDKKGEYIYQRPIVFMQILAGVAASDSHFNSILFGFGCYTADHFDGAAMSMAIYSLKSGMMNPHYVDGYIILCE